jgi:hypothetical protein
MLHNVVETSRANAKMKATSARNQNSQAIRLSLGYINNYATIIAHWLARFPLVPRWIVRQQGNFLVRGWRAEVIE